MAAASEGVAKPKTMLPSTPRISTVSGKNEVSSILTTSKNGTSLSSAGSFGASFGLMIARAITYST